MSRSLDSEGLAGGSFEPDERELFDHLVEELSACFDPRELRSRGAAGLREIALAAVPLLRQRRPGEIALRVANVDGGRGGRAAIEILIKDQPFLVDTLRLNLRRLGLREVLLLHPLLAIERERDGAAIRVGKRTGTPERESYIYAEVTAFASEERRDQVARELRDVFEGVANVVADHGRMVKALREHTADVEFAAPRIAGGTERARKLESFLDWLAEDNFLFLGYRSYAALRDGADWSLALGPVPGLGLMRDDSRSRFRAPVSGADLPAIIRARLDDGRMVFFDKSNSESRIHRSGRLDSVCIKTLDEQGRVAGFGRFIGLLTHKAVRARGSEIPLLRERLGEVLTQIGAEPGSHTYKTTIEAYDSLPVEFLFPFSVSDVTRAVDRILHSMEQNAIEVFTVPDPLQRSFFASMILPRPRYDETLRRDVERLLSERFGVTYVDHRTSFLDDEVALIHFFCSCREDVDAATLADLERELVARAASWSDRFEAALLDDVSEECAYRLADSYGAALPAEYRVVTPPRDAVRDVAALERLRTGECAVDLGLCEDDAGARTSRLKVYQRNRPYLTDLLPVLDDFALRVIDATLTELSPAPGETLWITTFRIEALGSEEGAEERVLEGLRAALGGRVETDALNRLVRGADLDWRIVDVLRAYLAWAQQLGIAPDRAFVAETLLRYPAAARELWSLFFARFSPDVTGDRDEAQRTARARLARAREPIPTFAEDQVLGQLANLIESTLRTSFFASTAEGPHEVAFKLDPRRVVGAPSPLPFAEIFVHTPAMMGVHLRGGPVARGGVRWADRVQGFRDEILGLMKTQMVKNGLIVPVGSKGGFVLRRRIADPAEARREADRQYERFVRALLRLTDDVDAHGARVPCRVVRHDRDDAYLVVAPDKGTAHLSDAANRVACEEGYWLGDAFASGGSNGYDHRREGITARGAWVCARRHFAELGVDVDSESITVAGIGDMSGDVFGNGMLLAPRARLLAAFDHRHVFVDPDPDPVEAWNERKRLAALPGSSWADYDPARLSAGGGVWERDARSVELSDAARELLGIEAEHPSGEDLIRAVLRMPVDLLWSAGVGTYVKATRESDLDVGDRANVGVRISASELRARVICEGGNLGLTQGARIEYALRGGRINTDAVDNSGGVDLSDHEVNFKVLLSGAGLSEEERSDVLRSCVEAASRAALLHCESQARCISLDRLRSEEDPERMVQAAVFLARHAGLDWRLEFLPEREELRARTRPGAPVAGYTRPELAVLLGYTKMLVKRSLVMSDVVDHLSLATVRLGYFPELLRERFTDEIHDHQLKREITATCLTNRVLDHAGVTLVPELVQATGASVSDVVAAFFTVDRLLEADHLRWAIASQALPETTRLRALLVVDDAVRAGARARLGLERRVLLEPEEIAHWTGLVRSLREILNDVIGALERERVRRQADSLEAEGLPADLALEIARLPWLVGALSVVSLVVRCGTSLPRAVGVYTRIGEQTGIAWLLDRLGRAKYLDSWDRGAAEALYLEVSDVQRRLTERVIQESDDEDPRIGLSADNAAGLRQIEETIREIEADDHAGVAALTVLAQQIRRLV